MGINKFVLMFALVVMFSMLSVSAVWWDTNYTQKQQINVTTTNSVTKSNVSVLINITYTSGMKTDFGDVRFVDAEEDEELGYWFYNNTCINSNSCSIWVKMNRNISSAENTSIYMYFDNSSVTTTSDISKTFLFGEDFNILNWSVWQSNNQIQYSVGGGRLNLSGSNIYNNLINTQTSFNDYVTVYRAMSSGAPSTSLMLEMNPSALTTKREDAIFFQVGQFALAYGGVQPGNANGWNPDTWYYGIIDVPASGDGSSYWTNESSINVDNTKWLEQSGTPSDRTAYIGAFQYQGGNIGGIDWVYARRNVNLSNILFGFNPVENLGGNVTFLNLSTATEYYCDSSDCDLGGDANLSTYTGYFNLAGNYNYTVQGLNWSYINATVYYVLGDNEELNISCNGYQLFYDMIIDPGCIPSANCNFTMGVPKSCINSSKLSLDIYAPASAFSLKDFWIDYETTYYNSTVLAIPAPETILVSPTNNTTVFTLLFSFTQLFEWLTVIIGGTPTNSTFYLWYANGTLFNQTIVYNGSINSSSCNQEFANYTTGCGLSTGKYYYNGFWDSPDKLLDGDWSAFSNGVNAGSINDVAVYIVNYTKPVGTVSALWNLKISDLGDTNVSIPAECLRDIVSLKLNNSYNSTTGITYLYCYDGLSYEYLYASPPAWDTVQLWEEAIVWNMTTISYNTTITLPGVSENYTWNANSCGNNTNGTNCSFANSNYTYNMEGITYPLIQIVYPLNGSSIGYLPIEINFTVGTTNSLDNLTCGWYKDNDYVFGVMNATSGYCTDGNCTLGSDLNYLTKLVTQGAFSGQYIYNYTLSLGKFTSATLNMSYRTDNGFDTYCYDGSSYSYFLNFGQTTYGAWLNETESIPDVCFYNNNKSVSILMQNNFFGDAFSVVESELIYQKTNVNISIGCNNFTTILPDGWHNITVEVINQYGLINSSEVSFYSNTVKPIFYNMNPLNNTIIYKISPDYFSNLSTGVYDTDLDNVTFNIYNASNTLINTTDFLSLPNNVTVSESYNLSEGLYYWEVLARDSFNHLSSNYTQFRVVEYNPLVPSITFVWPPNPDYYVNTSNGFNLAMLNIAVNITSILGLSNVNYILYINNTVPLLEYNEGLPYTNTTSYFSSPGFGGFPSNIIYVVVTATELYSYNTAIAYTNFTFDNINPNVVIINPPDNAFTNNNTVNFTANVTDNFGIQNITVNIYNQTALINQTNYTQPHGVIEYIFGIPLYLVNGIYTWFVSVVDWAGNGFTTSNYTVTEDTIIPGLSITYPLNQTYTTNVTRINFTISDINPSLCWYSLDNGMNNITTPCNINITGLTPSQGSQTWLVAGNDSAGNYNLSRVTFFVDSVGPTVIYNPNTDADGNTYTRNWTIINVSASDANNVINITVFIYNSSDTLVYQNTVFNDYMFVNFSVGADGLYTFGAYATDEFNNMGRVSNRTVNIQASNPFLGISSPVGNIPYTKIGNQLDVNWTATSAVGFTNCWATPVYRYSFEPFMDGWIGDTPVTEWSSDGIRSVNVTLSPYVPLRYPVFNLTQVGYILYDSSVSSYLTKLSVGIPSNPFSYAPNGTTYDNRINVTTGSGLVNLTFFADPCIGTCIGNYYKYGYIDNIRFYDKQGNLIPTGSYAPIGTCSNGNVKIPVGNNIHSTSVYVNNSVGTITSNTTYWNYSILELGRTYVPSVLSTSSQIYTINISTNGVYPITATLVYANQNYFSTRVGNTTQMTFTVVIDTPATNTVLNQSFYWNFTYGSQQIYSDASYQLLNPVGFGLCGGNLTTPTLNFTIKDEGTFAVLNGSFEMSILYGVGNGSTGINFTYQHLNDTDQSNYQFCIDHPNSTYILNGVVSYAKTGYDRREHFSINSIINNVTQNFPLYLLSTSVSDIVTFTVLDENDNQIQGAFIDIQRWDIGTNNFFEVGMIQTGADGKGIINLRLNDVWYRQTVIYNGRVYLVTPASKLDRTAVTLKIALSSVNPYLYFDNIGYNLVYNNASQTYTMTYADTTGSLATACLRIIQTNTSRTSQVYQSCVSSPSGSLAYTIPDNGTFIGEVVFTTIPSAGGLTSHVYNLIETVGTPDKFATMQGVGYVAGIMIIGTLGMIGVAVGSIPFALTLIVLGAITVSLLGLMNLTYSILASLAILAITIALVARRKFG